MHRLQSFVYCVAIRATANTITTTSVASFCSSTSLVSSRSLFPSIAFPSRTLFTRTPTLLADFDPESSSSSSSSTLPHFPPRRPSTSTQHIFGSFKIHKSKSALNVDFIRPKITRTTSSAAALASGTLGPANWQLKKPGAMKLDFAPTRLTESSTSSVSNESGNASYDWKQKISFQLNILEIGTFISFAGQPAATEAKFFHDPGLGTEDAGLISKELKVVRNGGGRGYFFNLVQIDASRNRLNISVPVSDGEFALIVVLAQNAVPQLLCMQTIEPQRVEAASFSPRENKE